MAEVREFKLPDLGEGLTEAEIARWLVEVGDVVAVDQPVVEVETAKAMVEVPCPYGGVVTARYGEEGQEIPVGAPLVTVASSIAAGTAATAGPTGPTADSGAVTGGSAAPGPGASGRDASAGDASGLTIPGHASPAPASAGAEEGSGNVLVGYGTSTAPRRRRRTAAGSAGRAGAGSAAAATAPAGSVPAPVRTPQPAPGAPHAPVHGDGPVPVISPLVRRLAREQQVDLRTVTGTGPDGLIMRADVLRTAAVQAAAGRPHGAPSTAASPGTVATGTGGSASFTGERVPLKGVRGAVADKLSRSRREIPDATTWVDADATELLAARRAMNAVDGPKISLLALLGRICVAALTRYPELNASVDADAREIVRHDAVHLGFAAQTERGLVVPVVRDAHTLGAEGITAEMGRLTEAARAGRLAPAQLTGGTFTLNNYGVFGVDGSTPIINHPEAAMLGVGRIVEKPWVHQGELAVRHVVQLSFTFDHRVCDGGTAGGFLRYVADCVEQPATLLRTL
ncbi:2-oxo acid dehydrogenase subunit E2 [Streptomyces sp. XM4193]|uniref:dihydrolipoamide acetyltransferase family protein n=1 Tax=Streptomyces sp. XM4193 TaxID=2929782 RepID=UPI001FF99311|nr:dihydrolipoamide acetyltransferase family protein [Streptomyces sp. XM4193]MCK1794511.1 2-oxo acid dehydrogenase subunit E2 [Streptomyces sp. XM4193]